MLRRYRTLKSKLLSIMLTAMLAISAVLLGSYGWSSYHLERERLSDIEREIRAGIASKATALTRNQSLALAGLVIDNAFGDVRQLVANAVNDDPDVLYGVFVSAAGKVWAFSTPSGRSSSQSDELLELPSLPAEVRPGERALSATSLERRELRAYGQTVHEYSAPVMGDDRERLGTIIYGFSDKRAHEALAAAAQRSKTALTRALRTSAAAGAIVLFFSLAWILSSAARITRPVTALTQAANQIASGTRGIRVAIRSGDEVELLASAFNQMLETNERTMRELEVTTERALTADRLKSQFLANMSHEIRTPMNGVLGVVELIQGMTLDRRLRRYVDTIDASANALMVIIDDILDFSKMEAGKYDLRQVAFDPQIVVQEVAELLASRAQDKGIELICHVHGPVPQLVLGDPDRFRQILSNLVGNAIKFTNTGEIVIELGVVEHGATSVRVEVAVADTGIGIAERDLPRLFKAFSQVDGTLVRRQAGTGLGLTISKRLVEMMGGELSVESVVGKGSTFRFSVAWQVVADAHERSMGRDNLKDVLVIDPSPKVRGVLAEHLAAWGFEPATAESRAAALRLLSTAAHPFDAVIFSGGLSDASPEQLVRSIRELPGGRELPLLMLTSSKNVVSTEVEGHLSAQLRKPVRFSELHGWLTGSLSSGHTSIEPATLQQVGSKSARAVLVVDDNDINRFVAVEALAQRGYHCEEAANGRIAVEMVASSEYLCVLMDCQMPEMDGYEASRAIRKLEMENNSPRTPIIALTAHAMVGEREKAIQAGMDDFMSKPFRPSSLERLLEHHGRTSNSVAPTAAGAAPPAASPRLASDPLLPDLDPSHHRSDKLIRLFLAQTPGQLSLLQAALAEGDAKAVRAHAHKLKGSCLALGAPRLSSEVEALRAHAAADQLGRAASLLGSVRERHERVRELLEAELQQRLAATGSAQREL